jgi:hypothetical protein
VTAARPARRSGVRPERVLWYGLAGALTTILLLFAWNTRSDPSWGYDLDAYIDAARRLVGSLPLYQGFTQDGPFRPDVGGAYLYPPPLAVLLMPLASLDPSIQLTTWTVAHVLALVAACWLMPVGPWVRVLCLLLGGFGFPFLSDMVLGNVSTFVLLATVLAWRWLDRPAGSAALAAGIALRPTLGLVLLLWLLQRAWQPLAWALMAGLALIAVTLPVVGIDGYLGYVALIRNLSVDVGVHLNSSLGSVAWRSGLPADLADVLLLAGYPMALAVVVLASRLDREAAFVTAATAPLLAPLLWGHYLLSLLVPVALLVQRGHLWVAALPLGFWMPTLVPGTDIVYPLLTLVIILLVPLLTWERRRTSMAEGSSA